MNRWTRFILSLLISTYVIVAPFLSDPRFDNVLFFGVTVLFILSVVGFLVMGAVCRGVENGDEDSIEWALDNEAVQTRRLFPGWWRTITGIVETFALVFNGFIVLGFLWVVTLFMSEGAYSYRERICEELAEVEVNDNS